MAFCEQLVQELTHSHWNVISEHSFSSSLLFTCRMGQWLTDCLQLREGALLVNLQKQFSFTHLYSNCLEFNSSITLITMNEEVLFFSHIYWLISRPIC